MKKLSILVTCFACLAGPTLADPIEGMWKTAPDDHGDVGFIKVSPCGTSFCGTLVSAQNSAGAKTNPPTIGRKIVWDVVRSEAGAYNGRIYAPDRDKEYASKMKLSGSSLTVSGCVLGGMICREGGVWHKLN